MKTKLLIALCATLGAGSAVASPVVLDFEGLGNLAAIQDFYNGGTDGAGYAGTNYGITFSASALGLIDADAGGTGTIANEPSGQTVLYFPSGAAILNAAAGFTTGVSFYYSLGAPGVVNVYSGVNATGDLLGSISLAAQYTNDCTGDPTGIYCNFSLASITFAGTARSIDFTGVIPYAAFDDITFDALQPAGEVPEPATLASIGLGLLGAGAARRRRPGKKA